MRTRANSPKRWEPLATCDPRDLGLVVSRDGRWVWTGEQWVTVCTHGAHGLAWWNGEEWVPRPPVTDDGWWVHAGDTWVPLAVIERSGAGSYSWWTGNGWRGLPAVGVTQLRRLIIRPVTHVAVVAALVGVAASMYAAVGAIIAVADYSVAGEPLPLTTAFPFIAALALPGLVYALPGLVTAVRDYRRGNRHRGFELEVGASTTISLATALGWLLLFAIG